MFTDSRFTRALLFLYLSTSLSLGVLLLWMSFLLVASRDLTNPAEMHLIPIDQVHLNTKI
jgi:hypothetical protein